MGRLTTPMRGQLLDAAAHRGVLPDVLVERRLAATDADRLGRLLADGYRGTVDDPGEDDAWHHADAVATLEGTYGRVLWEAGVVAVDGQQLAGAAIVTDNDPHLLLAFAVVRPEWRSQGVGAALVAASARSLLACSYTEWTLAVTVGNPARRLYERLGFEADESLRTKPST